MRKTMTDENLTNENLFDDLNDETPLTDEGQTETVDPDYEEFERMLMDFINQEPELALKKVPEEPMTEDEEEGDDEVDDFLMNLDDDDLMDDDSTADDDDETQTNRPTVSSTVVEQNGAISVKVDILLPIDNPREELDKLVGCEEIKRRMDELVALTRYNKMMSEQFPGSKQHDISLHSLFLGRPGTGKTTVCKIYGSLLRQAGALSQGHVVVCNRGTFIGTLWGDEERAMQQVLDAARGGVLMIDEAYLLNSNNANDPGKIVIQLLMTILADESQRDIAIVLCGYKEPMQKLLDLNPGLQSRFPNRFEFTDFTVDELLSITKSRVKDYEYRFTDMAWEKYRRMMAQAYQVRDPETWGNARFVANQLERIYIQHASRCVRQQPLDKSDLRVITADDIVSIDVPRQKSKMGF